MKRIIYSDLYMAYISGDDKLIEAIKLHQKQHDDAIYYTLCGTGRIDIDKMSMAKGKKIVSIVKKIVKKSAIKWYCLSEKEYNLEIESRKQPYVDIRKVSMVLSYNFGLRKRSAGTHFSNSKSSGHCLIIHAENKLKDFLIHDTVLACVFVESYFQIQEKLISSGIINIFD